MLQQVNHTKPLVIATLLVLSTCACAKAGPTAPATPTPASTPVSSSPTPSQVTPTPTPTPTPSSAGVPVGRAAIYRGGDLGTWAITLTKARCGLTTIPAAQINPAWKGTGQSQYVAAHPDKGNDFCELTWTWKNQGSRQTNLGMAGDMLVNGQLISRSGEDLTRSINTTKARVGIDYTMPVAAGASVKHIDIYQVPHQTLPTTVWAPMGASPIAFAVASA